MTRPAWIGVDWGTSHLRVWLMDAYDHVLDKKQSADGMSTLDRTGFQAALHALTGPFDGPIIACGMVGAREGWAEAPYATVPCAPPTIAQATAIGPVRILPGVKQTQPADVMRGEETQIAGFVAAHPGFDGVICLPGTHTKWAHISAGEIVSFRTAMTGEMFALLSRQSVLRHSVSGSWDESAFADAMSETLSRPETLASALFNIRASVLLEQRSAGAMRARLSGLLIGAELAAMRPYWLGQQVALVGTSELADIYAYALKAQGIVPAVADAEGMTLRGLIAAKAALETT